MTYTVETSTAFLRQAHRFFRKHPELRSRFEAVVERLRTDPFEPGIRLHKLGGSLADVYAARLTYEYRVTLSLLVTEHTILLLDIGTHDEVYRDA